MDEPPTLEDVDEALTQTSQTLLLPLTPRQRDVVADYIDDLLDLRLELCAASR